MRSIMVLSCFSVLQNTKKKQHGTGMCSFMLIICVLLNLWHSVHIICCAIFSVVGRMMKISHENWRKLF